MAKTILETAVQVGPHTCSEFRAVDLVDFDFQNHGSLCILYALTEEAAQWVTNNLPEDRTEFCGGTVIEPRYAGDILFGIDNDGLTVRS
jgi:hypothetical protein